MRFALAILYACGCVDLSEPPGWSEAADHINASPACVATVDPSACEAARQSWPQTYVDALSGDRTAQHTVALCLSSSCGGAIRQDPVLACAWSLVLQGDGAVGAGTVKLANEDCAAERLRGGDLSTATAKADALRLQMRKKT